MPRHNIQLSWSTISNCKHYQIPQWSRSIARNHLDHIFLRRINDRPKTREKENNWRQIRYSVTQFFSFLIFRVGDKKVKNPSASWLLQRRRHITHFIPIIAPPGILSLSPISTAQHRLSVLFKSFRSQIYSIWTMAFCQDNSNSFLEVTTGKASTKQFTYWNMHKWEQGRRGKATTAKSVTASVHQHSLDWRFFVVEHNTLYRQTLIAVCTIVLGAMS